MTTYQATVTVTQGDLVRLKEILELLDARAYEIEDDFPEEAKEIDSKYETLHRLVTTIEVTAKVQ